MATVGVTHSKVVTIPDDPNYPVGSDEWNDDHVVTGLENVDNTSDANKPVSTAQAAAISTAVAGVTKASIGLGNVDNTSDVSKFASPALTGTPTAPTAALGTNTTQISTTAFVQAAVAALIAGAPGALDTLKELADAINDDASYAATITTALALKAPLASPTLTGTPAAPTAAAGVNTTQVATTANVLANIAAEAVRYDAAQSLTSAQQGQSRANAGVPGRNVLINSDFRINQRVYVSGAALAVGIYGHDRWKAGAGGGDYSFTQLASSTQITIAASKSLIQVIEDKNVVGGSYVLSWTGTAQGRYAINSATPAGAYAASPILITGQTAGTVMSIEFNTGTLGTVKLETGTVATPFVMSPFPKELVDCQRYYEKSYNAATPLGTATTAGAFQADYGTNSTTQGGGTLLFKVPKRASPTFTTYDDLGASGKWTNTAGNGRTPSFSADEKSCHITALAGDGACTFMRCNWTAEAEL